MKRFLAALTVALLFGLVMISVVGGVAFGDVVPRVQAEPPPMTWPSGSDIIVRDETTDDGMHIRYTGNADQADRATWTINPSQQVDQILLRVRESGTGAGDDRLAVYVDSNPTPVGFVQPPAGSRWETHVLDLSSSPISAGTHTLAIGPAQANDAFVALDWFELHNHGTTTPDDTDGDGVPDSSDNCPNEFGPVSNNGCPESQPGTIAKLVGAGDIADTGNADLATGNLIDDRPNATVFTAGDNAYPSGSASDFNQKYEPTWGPFKARTWPSPGNHDYRTSGASGYKGYFDAGTLEQATPIGTQTYYGYNLGNNWRVYSLDSNISMASGSAQYNWLANDLTNNPKPCVAAYWHHPTASSGQHGPTAATRPIFALLDQRGAELVINAHDHNYERFGKINSSGATSSTGVVAIVVGTGGAELRPFPRPPLNSTEVRNADTHGILELDLSATGYTGRFVPAQGFGNFEDSFRGDCT